jgi:predicted glycosyltransferase
MKKNTITHVAFAKLATAFAAAKSEIEAQLRVRTITEMAAERSIPKSTFKNLCEVVGIDVRACLFPVKAAKLNQSADASHVVQDIIKQLADVCMHLNIEPAHIAKYLN